VAGASSVFQAEEKPNPHIPPVPLPDPRACSQSELAVIQAGLPTILPKVDLPSSAGELLVATNGVWFNNQFLPTDGIRQQSFFASSFQKNAPEGNLGLSMSLPVSDWRTFHNYLARQQETNGEIPYQVRGESALALGNYNQAVYDFGKAIEIDPANPFSYLERGSAHFALGEYDRSLEDYQQFASQTKVANPLSVSEFCGGFAKGLPKGVYESGEGVLLFLADFVKHPVQTSKQMIDAITMLADLVRKDEWGALAEALSPEIHQLVTQWDTLPSDQRGELAGYAVGKHGTDILAPGALAKIASKSLKSAQELVAVCKNIQIVQETLILETAAGIGNGAKITEVIEVGRKTAFLADELGFTAKEMGQLKQAGELETAVANASGHLSLSMQESIKLFEQAGEKLKPHQGIYMSESQIRELIGSTGIPTFVRPKGIPENYRVKLSDKPGGIKYVHPTDEGTYIRIMPGKPHSKNPSQQKPYVNQRINGKSIDKHGNIVSNKSEEAHIPIEEFIYREIGKD
jgi:tetratricopeptide (TPR) repeat protein